MNDRNVSSYLTGGDHQFLMSFMRLTLLNVRLPAAFLLDGLDGLGTFEGLSALHSARAFISS